MYGTIGHFRVKAGKEEQLLECFRQIEELRLPGTLMAFCYRQDSSPNDFYIAVVSESKETYFTNAMNPEALIIDEKLITLLESEPEWHDGEIVYALKDADKDNKRSKIS